VLQLVGGFTALTVLGAFTSPNGLQVLLATMILSVAVLLLVLGAVRDGTRPTG
jgi:NaMN:DMB phosphoribosyltransferase